MERAADKSEISPTKTWNINGMSIEMASGLTAEDRGALWDMLQVGFMDLNAQSYEKQDMTRDEFDADVDSKDVYKYVARSDEGQPIGLLMVHVGLENITWADMSEQRQLQAEADSTAIPYYVGTMVVSVDKRATRTVYNLIKGSFLDLKHQNDAFGKKSLVFFDCAEANHPGLPNLIRKACRPSEGFSGINAEVRELYVETILQDNAGGSYKVKEQPDAMNDRALDIQHYYAVML